MATKKGDSEGPRRNISAVVFDVRLEDPSGEWDLPSVLLQVFAFTPAVTLRVREGGKRITTVKYASGDYDKQGKNVWSGRMEMIRETKLHAMHFDRNRGNVFDDDEGNPVTTSESTSFLAYHEKKGIIAYRDRALMPYTRLASYVKAAVDDAIASDTFPEGMRVRLEPRKVKRTIREWVDSFTSITAVRLKYGHSRSPGNRSIDALVTALNAREISETVTAKAGETLNPTALLDKGNHIGKAIDHIEVNPDNGTGRFEGTVDGEAIKVNTRTSVERHRIGADIGRRGFVGALFDLVLRLPASEDVEDDGDEEA